LIAYLLSHDLQPSKLQRRCPPGSFETHARPDSFIDHQFERCSELRVELIRDAFPMEQISPDMWKARHTELLISTFDTRGVSLGS
jgi:hypothetical protein